MEPKVILLVDDKELDQLLALRAFRKGRGSNQVVVASDGLAALDYLFCEGTYSKRSPADLPTVVFLDLKLPRLDSLEVLDRIRANERTCSLLVVLFSASCEQRDVDSGDAKGCNSYVLKPLDPEEFIATVQELEHYWIDVNLTPPESSRH